MTEKPIDHDPANIREQVLAALRSGRERIVRGWTRGTPARDVSGEPVLSQSKNATCWCAVGALYAGKNREYVDILAVRALDAQVPAFIANNVSRASRVATFNDNYATQTRVLALYDRAIQAVEKDEVPS